MTLLAQAHPTTSPQSLRAQSCCYPLALGPSMEAASLTKRPAMPTPVVLCIYISKYKGGLHGTEVSVSCGFSTIVCCLHEPPWDLCQERREGRRPSRLQQNKNLLWQGSSGNIECDNDCKLLCRTSARDNRTLVMLLPLPFAQEGNRRGRNGCQRCCSVQGIVGLLLQATPFIVN